LLPTNGNLLVRPFGGGGGHVFRIEMSNPLAPHSDERPRCQLIQNTGDPAGISDAGIGLTGHPSTMIDQVIDLTTMQPSKVLRTRFTPTDLMWIVVVGGVPYLAREAFRYLFPRRPTVVDQLKVLAELIAAAGEAKAKSLKVRISTAAKTRWEN